MKLKTLFVAGLILALMVGLAGPVGLAAAPAEKVDFLIGFHAAPGPAEQAMVRGFGGDIYREFTIVNVIAARMSPRAADALARSPRVAYVEPDALMYALDQTVPWGVDRVFGNETHPFSTWSTSTGQGIGVAVLDTGIDATHEDLTVTAGINTMDGADPDNWADGHGHGTHVAGTIAALDNTWGVVGVAPAVSLYAVKVLSDGGSGSVSGIVAGIQWAVDNNIQIINMSLGSSTHSQSLQDACDAAYYDAGLLVVSSAGNSGNPAGRGDNVGYPAKYDSVVAVAASTINDTRASYSSTGPAVELIAPGSSILSTLPGNNYGTYSGTSMASPHVAGVAALVLAAKSSLTNVQIRAILQETAEDLGLSANHQGYGLVRADLAVAAAGGEPPPPPQEYDLIISSTAGGSVVTPGEGTFTYDEGTVVDLVAQAASGYQFVNWTGDTGTIADVNAASTTITMNGNYSITANFEEKPPAVYYDLTISSGTGGSVTTPGEGIFNYEEGTVVDLVAQADSGYVFVEWTGDIGTIANVNSASTTITMNGNYSITATFEEAPVGAVVRVESITYTTSGGRLSDRHLHITLLLLDDQDNPVAGASVSATLHRDAGGSWSFAGTTGSNGTVTFTLNNHGSGCYNTVVTAVVAEGLEWDGVTPENSYCK